MKAYLIRRCYIYNYGFIPSGAYDIVNFYLLRSFSDARLNPEKMKIYTSIKSFSIKIHISYLSLLKSPKIWRLETSHEVRTDLGIPTGIIIIPSNTEALIQCQLKSLLNYGFAIGSTSVHCCSTARSNLNYGN